jgi:hypothetical protein
MYGSTHAWRLRYIAVIAEFAVLVFMLFRACSPFDLSSLPTWLVGWIVVLYQAIYWGVGTLFLAVACWLSWSLVLKPDQFRRFDWDSSENAGWIRYFILGKNSKEWRISTWQWCRLVIILALVISSFATALWLGFGLSLPGTVWFLVFGWLTLILGLLVPSNIIILSAVRREYLKMHQVGPQMNLPTDRYVTFAIQVIPVTVLYMVSISTFAHSVYPWIPEGKAGGSYVASRAAIIHLVRGASTGTCGTNAFQNVTPSFLYFGTDGSLVSPDTQDLEDGEHMIIEEDANWVYVAKLEKNNCPEDWQRTLLQVKLDEFKRPIVYAVNRNCIEYTTYEKRVTEEIWKNMSDGDKRRHVCLAKTLSPNP